MKCSRKVEKMVKLTPEAHAALTRWQGRLMRLRGVSVYFSDALLDAISLADTHRDEEITTLSKGERTP